MLLVAIPNAFEAGRSWSRRAANPRLEIVARAHFDAEVEHLLQHGADIVIIGEREIARRWSVRHGRCGRPLIARRLRCCVSRPGRQSSRRSSSATAVRGMPGSILEDYHFIRRAGSIGSIPIFLNATEGSAPRPPAGGAGRRVRGAARADAVPLLRAVRARRCTFRLAFRIAGAAVLFVFALQMIFGGHHASGSAGRGGRRPGRDFPGGDARHRQPGALLAVVPDRQRPVLFGRRR
jgi:hypothetical protein